MNNFNTDYMRTEIAVLQEDVSSSDPGYCNFTIPVLMTEDTVAVVSVNNANILNRRNGNLKASSINLNNTIELYIPRYLLTAYTQTNDTIPKGTKFIVSLVGGDPNQAKIIGVYDEGF